jgi:glycolate oxidase FAD binding subunit
MDTRAPESADQLATVLHDCASGKQRILLGGGFSKDRMGGPLPEHDVRISTRRVNRLLQYEPQDLTVSVEAGMKWSDFQRVLLANRQTVPLDPPVADEATVGGVVASNCSGPRRRLYGSARDVVIGMKFATLEGKLVETGGMVVKNVAGLDIGKLLIGSFGTLAAIVQINFKVSPVPPFSQTFLHVAATCSDAMKVRDKLLRGVMQPVAVDLLNPHASARMGREGWLLAIQAAGSEQVVERWKRELTTVNELNGEQEIAFWQSIREFSPHFLNQHADGAVARVSMPLAEMGEVAATIPVPLVARAGTGVGYAHFSDCESGARWLAAAVIRGGDGVLEWIPQRQCTAGEQWPRPGDDFDTMRKVKGLFDPTGVLNPGRLYGRL